MRGDTRWDETWHRLRDWTQGQAPSERLAQQILLCEGFTGLDPSHPLGGKDGGADALACRDGLRWVMGVYFPRGQQALKEIENKFIGDFEGVETNGADAFAFVTNQELRRAERRDLSKMVGGTILIFHLERLVAILDQPKMYGVRRQFPASTRRTALWIASRGWRSCGEPRWRAARRDGAASVYRQPRPAT